MGKKTNSLHGKLYAIEARFKRLEAGLESINSYIAKTEKTGPKPSQPSPRIPKLSETVDITQNPEMADNEFSQNSGWEDPDEGLEPHIDFPNTQMGQSSEARMRALKAKMAEMENAHRPENSELENPCGFSMPELAKLAEPHLESKLSSEFLQPQVGIPITQMQQLSETVTERIRALEATMGSLLESISNTTIENSRREDTQNSGPGLFLPPVVDFPKFGGENPRFWVSDCETLFELVFVPERKKVILAALHMEGKARNWYRYNAEELKEAPWSEFAELVCKKFARSTGEIMSDFKNLSQEGSVEEYMGKFEELQYLLRHEFKGLSKGFFLDCFLTGLKDEIRYRVQTMSPKSIDDAFHTAKLEEQHLFFLEESMKNQYV